MKTIKFFIVIIATVVLIIGCNSNKENKLIEVTGTIEATNVIVSSLVAGEVISIFKDEGDRASIGDTLLIIDPTTYKIKLREAEALLLSAEAQYELVRNGARKEDIQQAQQLLKQSEVNLQTAQNDKIRFENLYETKSISRKQYEDALAKYELTLAQYNSAKENFLKIQNISRPEELKQAKANVERLKANVDLIKKSLNDCFITAPISGIVVKKFVEAGETVTNLSSLIKISDLSQVELTVYVNEKDLPKIKLSQPVDVKVDAYPEKTYKGKIIFISPEAEFTPKNIQTKEERTKLVFAVKVKIDNPEYELKSGIPADAFIKVEN